MQSASGGKGRECRLLFLWVLIGSLTYYLRTKHPCIMVNKEEEYGWLGDRQWDPKATDVCFDYTYVIKSSLYVACWSILKSFCSYINNHNISLRMRKSFLSWFLPVVKIYRFCLQISLLEYFVLNTLLAILSEMHFSFKFKRKSKCPILVCDKW